MNAKKIAGITINYIFKMLNKIVLIFILIIFTCNVNAATYTVTSSADSGAGTLRDIMGTVNNGDIIEFDSGVTYITLTSGRLNINDSIHIKGPGPANLTIDGNASSRCFYMAQAGVTSLISGITITNCAVTVTSDGGAIYLGTSSNMQLTVSNCIITACSSQDNGGAVILREGTANFINSTIIGCTSGNNGGGIFAEKGVKLTIKTCTISNNTSGNKGGGVELMSSDTSVTGKITNCTFSHNIATGNGGGIYTDDGHIIIKNCTFSGNQVTGANNDGGAVYSGGNQSFILLDSSTFTGNSAADDGGAFYSSDPNIVQNCTFSGNTAFGDGGGIFFKGGTTETQSIYNCTFYGNTSTNKGGGIRRDGGKENIYSSIIANNTNDDINGSINIMNYCLANIVNGSISSSTNNISGNPQLKPLTDNGGPTLTHALAKGSIAINKGSNPLSLAYDQRGTGYSREVNQPDIGAYEYNAGAPKDTVIIIK